MAVDEYEVYIPGYWVQARFSTLEEAREVAKGIIRSPGTEHVDVLTMQKYVEPNGRTYWALSRIELWAPRLDGIDTSDRLRVIDGRIVSGKYVIGDEFVCFCRAAEERQREKELDPDAAEWLDNPPWDRHPSALDQMIEVGQREGGKTTLYRDPASGEFWELCQPGSERHRGGPPTLTKLSTDEVQSLHERETT